MYNRILLIFLSSLIVITTYAQPYFFNSKKPQTSSSGAGLVTNSTVVSPSDYSDGVDKITAQKQAAFQQQLSQKLTTLAPPPSSPSTGNMPSEMTPNMPQPTTLGGGLNNNPPPSRPAPAPAPTPVYTGFSGGNANPPPATGGAPFGGNTNTGTTQPKSSGGWNIRY